MIIIPSIDIIDKKCVRLKQGDFNIKSVYDMDPISQASVFQKAGAVYLHIVDLDAAKNIGNNLEIIENIKNSTKITIQVGGGIKDESYLNKLFEIGIDRVVLGTIAVNEQKLVSNWIKKYGANKFVIACDVQNGMIAINGWQTITKTSIQLFLEMYEDYGAKYFLCTDIEKDGMMNGISVELYLQLNDKFQNLNFIASGGVGSIQDIEMAKNIGMYGIIVGKALYEGIVKIENLF